MSRESERESWRRVGETCPAVGRTEELILKDLEVQLDGLKVTFADVLSQHMDEMKQQTTYKLRQALIESIDETAALQGENDGLVIQLEAAQEDMREMINHRDELAGRILELEQEIRELKPRDIGVAMRLTA